MDASTYPVQAYRPYQPYRPYPCRCISANSKDLRCSVFRFGNLVCIDLHLEENGLTSGLRRDLGTIESYATLIGILIGAGIFKVTSDPWTLTGPSVIHGSV